MRSRGIIHAEGVRGGFSSIPKEGNGVPGDEEHQPEAELAIRLS
jgi:hypothetical protein